MAVVLSLGSIFGGASVTQQAQRGPRRPTAVLWVHGGGWSGGSPTDNPAPRAMAHRVWPDAVDIDIDYPVGPGSYPANVAAVQASIDQAVDSGWYSRVVVVGYSAGGFLTLAADTSRVDSVITLGAPSSLDLMRHRDPQTAQTIREVFGTYDVPWGRLSGNVRRVCGQTDTIVYPSVCEPGAGWVIWAPTDHSFDHAEQAIALAFAG
jgi:hypothetical protein